MEENYLVSHSAQAPSQKVGVGRILGSRRVVGRAFFAATFVVAAGGVRRRGDRLRVRATPGRRLRAGRPGAVDRHRADRRGRDRAIRHGRDGHHDVVLRAMMPANQRSRRGRSAARGGGAAVLSRRRLRHLRRRPLGPQPPARAAHRGDEADGRGLRRRSAAAAPPGSADLAGTDRQEIEAIGVPATALLALDRPLAFELPAARLGVAGALPRGAALVGRDRAARSAATAPTRWSRWPHAHYAAYSRTPAADPVAPAPLDPRARAAYLALPDDLRDVKVLARRGWVARRTARAADRGRHRVAARGPRLHDDARVRRPPASIRSTTSCSPNARATASTSRRRRCCCCARRRSRPAT